MSREEKPYTLLYIHAHAWRSMPDWHPHSKDVFGKQVQPSKVKGGAGSPGAAPMMLWALDAFVFARKAS